MVIITKKRIMDFIHHHPDASQALWRWYELVKYANWSNFGEMRSAFNSLDAVGNNRYVFNIKGNHYRLIAMIFFNKRIVFIRFVGTHEEYDSLYDCSLM